MRELQVSFTGRGQVRGFEFTQLKKTKYAYMYKLEYLNRVWYEVFKHKENTQFNVVSYPSNKAFGIWAWTTSDKNKALDVFDEIDLKGETNDLESDFNKEW
jgi:hypothetical protein